MTTRADKCTSTQKELQHFFDNQRTLHCLLSTVLFRKVSLAVKPIRSCDQRSLINLAGIITEMEFD